MSICIDVSMGEYMKCVSTCMSLYESMNMWQCEYGESMRICVIVHACMCVCVIILVYV